MRIIASDYDGTLNFGGIDDRKRDAIARWRKAGNLFGMVSGRMVKSIQQKTDEAQIVPDFIIADSGGTVVTREGEVLCHTVVDGKEALKLAKMMLDVNVKSVNLHADFFCLIKPEGSPLKEDEFYLSNLPLIEQTPQVTANCANIPQALTLIDRINAEFSDTFDVLQNGRVVDVVPKGVNKARGIYTLINHLGIPKESVITVGDNGNDIHMLYEFNSYAMANGSDSAKAAAKDITLGICELIEKEL